MNKPNQDIRDYMEDNGVTQGMLAGEFGVSQWTICQRLKTELSQKDKEVYLNAIDSIAAQQVCQEMNTHTEEPAANTPAITTKFRLGDRVKVPSKQDAYGTVSDIWSSMAQDRTMYEVTMENTGIKGLYAEAQLEPAPIPTEFGWNAHIDGNVAVVTMIATQGEKTWIHARGHAHILHDGEVGMAQAISYAAKRMFESLDKRQENRIYVKKENFENE